MKRILTALVLIVAVLGLIFLGQQWMLNLAAALVAELAAYEYLQLANASGTRIPVWVLDNCRRLGMPDAQILSTYPSLPPSELDAAWDYVAANHEEIEQAIRENEAGNGGPVE